MICVHCPLGSKRDWWDPQTLSAFANRTACMKEQYDSFQVEEVCLVVHTVVVEKDV